MVANAKAQIISANALLDSSIHYHDPHNRWHHFSGELFFEQIRPGQPEWSRRYIFFNRRDQVFQMKQISGDTIIQKLDGDECSYSLNGNTELSQEQIDQYRISCDRTKMYRNYYDYLYGLPMKLKDPGTIIHKDIVNTSFLGTECYQLKVTYEEGVGHDIWYFYFNLQNYALIGYRFYQDESQNDGEYIALYCEEVIQGVKIPKNRFWYFNRNDQLIGVDLLMPESHKSLPIGKDTYQSAEQFLWENLDDKAHHLYLQPNWFPDSSGFWFREEMGNRINFKKLVFDHLSIEALFDHELLTSRLNEILDDTVETPELPIERIDYLNKDSLRIRINSIDYILDLADYEIVKENKRSDTISDNRSMSPDGQWSVEQRDFNLYLLADSSEQEIPISTDGSEQYQYASYYGWFDLMEGENTLRPGHFQVNWSDDSRYFQFNICDTRSANKMYLLDWSVDTLFRPNLLSYYRGSPGDTGMVYYIPKIYDVVEQRVLNIDLPRNTHINSVSFRPSLRPDHLYAEYADRGYKNAYVLSVDLENEQIEPLIKESSKTNTDHFRTWYFEEKDLILFTSERSGWNQLYSFHLQDRTIKPITEGEFVVNDVVHIDKENSLVYFMASGVDENVNPYLQKLYKIDLETQEMVCLIAENAHHEIEFSPGGRYFVDNYSAIDVPTISSLRSAVDGEILVEISRADLHAVFQMGWVPPQSFEFTAKDGKTKLYGALWKPTHFDPSRKYPIIDHSYSGPHTQMFPKNFRTALYRNNQALAEFGFIVMMVDGRGTAGRSKDFQDASYKNMGNNLEDHVLAITELGRRYAWIDTSKVGIFGHSAGGYDAAHALLAFPDIYKVGVASSADHDFRMEKAWWPEMYMGWPVDTTYHQVSNITMAPNLKGKLLITHGGLDDNVNPSATFKLAEALIKADKPFDLLILPSQRHGYQGNYAKYFQKVRWNYFMENLLGESPLWEW